MNDSLKIQLGNIVKSYLGPYKSNKFVLDEEVSLIKCPFQLLQKIKLKGGMTYIIEDALNLHHDQYKCSTTSLLAMWYFWYEEFQTALNEGCLLSDIIEHAQNILEDIISDLPEITTQYSSIFVQEQSASKSSLSQFDKHSDANQIKPSHAFYQSSSHTEVSNHNVPIGIRYSSRHYSPSSFHHHYLETEGKLVRISDSENKKHLIQMNDSLRQTMYNTVHKLSHGDSEFITLISEIWIKQVTFTNCRRFNIKGINICPITLPCSYSTVVDGLIIKSTLSSIHYQELTRHRENRALVIRSVAFEYVPLGCSPKVNITNKITAEELKVSEKALWVKKCCNLLLELQVNLLLVNGEVDSDIESFCSTESILVLHNIQWNTFAILSDFLDEPPCTYLLDCDSGNLLLNLAVEKWNFDDKIQSKEYLHIQIKDTVDKQLLTAVLCHPNCFALSSLEHQFWHDAFRLHLATTENKFIPGCGKTEEWCCNKLQMSSCKKNSRVNTAVAQGFKTYFENISNKTTQGRKETLDEMSSKTQAWRSAMALSLIPLQIDKVILTGLVNATEDLRHEEIIGVL